MTTESSRNGGEHPYPHDTQLPLRPGRSAAQGPTLIQGSVVHRQEEGASSGIPGPSNTTNAPGPVGFPGGYPPPPPPPDGPGFAGGPLGSQCRTGGAGSAGRTP